MLVKYLLFITNNVKISDNQINSNYDQYYRYHSGHKSPYDNLKKKLYIFQVTNVISITEEMRILLINIWLDEKWPKWCL